MVAAKRGRPPGKKSTTVKVVVPDNPAPYRVREGQSWTKVAGLHNTTPAKLKDLNPGISALKAGMRVRVK